MTPKLARRTRLALEWLFAGSVVVLFAVWLTMVFAQPRAHLSAQLRAQVDTACTDIAVLPFRNQKQVVLCAPLGAAGRQAGRFGTLSVALLASVVAFVSLNQRRKRDGADATKPSRSPPSG